MRRTRTIYTADFETNNSQEAIDSGKTFVWLWDICEMKTLKHTTGYSLTSFFKNLDDKKVDSILYFHNLKFDGTFILSYLLDNGYKWNLNREEIKKGEFSTIITKDKTFYNISYINANGCNIEFRDSSKKIPGTVESIAKSWNLPILKGNIDYRKNHTIDDATGNDVAYIKNDTEIIARVLQELYAEKMTALTNASDSLSAFKSHIGKELFMDAFPVQDIDVDDYIRNSYYGGYCFFNPEYKEKMLTGVLCYDVNSMYPYILCTRPMPVGTPLYFQGEPKRPNKLFIVRVMVRCKLKKHKYPSLMYRKKFFLNNSYIVDTMNEAIELTLTNIDYKHLLEDYDISYLEHIDGYYFTSNRTLFSGFIQKWYKVKQDSTGSRRQLAKIILNSLYGKFATNPYREYIEPYLEDGVVNFKSVGEYTIDSIYTAVSTFVTAYARDCLYNNIMNNKDIFVYCDTDSIHTIGEASGLEIDKDKLGAWDLEKRYKNFKVLAQKTYIGELENGSVICKSCGCPYVIRKTMDFDNFKFGMTFKGKLIPKNVKGGVVLVETEFTIKERGIFAK